MNFILFWIDVLLVALLWSAWLVSIAARSKKTLLRVLLLLLTAAPLLPLGAFGWAGWMLKFQAHIQPNWFAYSASLLAAYVVGAMVALRTGMRSNWRPIPIFAGGVLAFAMGYMTLIDMDFALRSRYAIRSVELNTLDIATSPAIVSESQNAAVLYEKAFARLGNPTDIKNSPYGDNAKYDPGDPGTRAYLTQQVSTIGLLQRAAALPACRFDSDLEGVDIDTLLAGGAQMRSAANLLWLDGRDQLARGNTAGAMTDAAAIYAISRHCTEKPMMISGLVGIGIDAIAFALMQQVLPVVKDAHELEPLHLENLTSFRRLQVHALRGEERLGLITFGNLMRDDDAWKKIQQDLPIPTAGLSGSFYRVFLANPDRYLALIEEAQRVSPKPYFEAHEAFTRYQETHSDTLFASIAGPSLEKAMIDSAIGDANDLLAGIAVAITRYRIDNKAVPKTINKLIPKYLDEVPLDPFDGKPIRMVRKNDELLIYSIGQDGVDDGGAKGEDPHTKDIVFSLK